MSEVTYNNIVDQIEDKIAQEVPVECPVQHYFLNGVYCRQIFIPKGAFITSKVHRYEHPYILSVGELSVIKEDDGATYISAPFSGITPAGARRVAYAHTDAVWTTFHPTDISPKDNSKEAMEEAVALIEAEVIVPYVNQLIEKRKEQLT